MSMSLHRALAPLTRTSLQRAAAAAAAAGQRAGACAVLAEQSGAIRLSSARGLSSSAAAATMPEAALASGSTPASSSPLPPAAGISGSGAAAAAAEPVSSTSQALSLLRTQPQHYVVASLVGRTFLLSLSDILTVPRLKDVRVGDVLELDRVHEVGSQDYTLRAQDPIAPRVRAAQYANTGVNPLEGANTTTKWTTRLIPAGLAFTGASLRPETVRVRCVVLEHTKGKMEYIVKKKRRKGYKKTIKHKQPYTRLRVEEIRLGDA
ncbi:hypothetical protein OC834_002066 [Tilletia horrida]|nr:hypothetical protein OC834_002066 [Tilletia horrida]